ncbi:MAG TPA: sigma-70 family RNA polymerase sigma factor [Chryseosolibacter sp.]
MKILMAHAVSETAKEEQFRSWVRLYSDTLFRHAILRGFDHDTARDLTQDTFISAWRSMHNFEGKTSVKNWLFVILRNKITDHYRKAVNHSAVFISDYDVQFDEGGHWAKAFYPRELIVNPAEAVDHAEFNGILQRCSDKLNQAQKAVFFMKYVDDLDSDDICVQLSITPNNYWTLLHRAKVQLRACLEKNWFLIQRI